MWSKEWPTETGWYWLYYSRQSYNTDKNCWETVYTLDSAQVRSAGKDPNKFLMYIRGGAFLFKCEEGTKYWQKMDEPELPNTQE